MSVEALMKDKNEPGWAVPCLVVLLVIAQWLAFGWWLPLHIRGDQAGTFGDQFGAVNALFSGLAFAGVIYAILLQRHELKLQRDELELTRGELQGQKEQLKAQNETLQLQNFENTFFQLLRLHNDYLNAIDLRKDGSVTATGRDCFAIFYGRLKKTYQGTKSMSGLELERENVSAMYASYYTNVEGELGHYFRSLYNLVKFVDSSSTTNKRLYTNLIRAQISKYELLLLFYNCISPLGREKFCPLVERYASSSSLHGTIRRLARIQDWSSRLIPAEGRDDRPDRFHRPLQIDSSLSCSVA